MSSVTSSRVSSRRLNGWYTTVQKSSPAAKRSHIAMVAGDSARVPAVDVGCGCAGARIGVAGRWFPQLPRQVGGHDWSMEFRQHEPFGNVLQLADVPGPLVLEI